MNAWKAIAVGVLIFCAGVLLGGLGMKMHLESTRAKTPRPNMATGPGMFQRTDMMRRLNKDMNLTSEQHKQIEAILKDSQERMKKLWESIAPDARKEFEETKKQIKATLTSEQRKRYEELMRQRQFHMSDSQREAWRQRNASKPGATNHAEAPTNAPARSGSH